MGQYIGIDLHKAKSFVTRLDRRGRVLEQVELAHATGALKTYVDGLPADSRIAVEATGNWMWLYEQIEERHPDLVLAHPLKTKAIASARIKTDKIRCDDARAFIAGGSGAGGLHPAPRRPRHAGDPAVSGLAGAVAGPGQE